MLRVTSRVGLGYPMLENILQLEQIRDIRLSVVNTINKDGSRILTYVTSPDFQDLKYQTFTELKREKRLPWFPGWWGRRSS